MRIKLFLSFTVIVLIAVASVVIFARQGAAGEVRAYMFRGGMSGVEDLVDALESYYQSNAGWEGVQDMLLAQYSTGRHMGQGSGMGPGGSGMGPGMGGRMNQRLRVADAQGNLVADTGAQAPSGAVAPEALQSAIRLQQDGSTVGYLLAEGGISLLPGAELPLINRITMAAITAGLIAVAISLLLALAIAYGLLRPVNALTRAAQAMEKGDLSVRVNPSGNDELSLLGRAFNRMAGALQQAEESRKAMTADIAHELRNPLAVQRASLEALQDGIYPLTPENLAPILEQNQHLTRLVDDLRTLALADAGQLTLERTPTEILPLLQRVVERYQPQAARQAISLQIAEPAQPLPDLPLDSLRIEQILANLITNALRFTPSAGRIRIAPGVEGRQVVIHVHDTGPGIPTEALPSIFERFFRGDRSRSRSQGGSGLGLAIARQLARAHGGDLSAENHPTGGAVFHLSLPYNP
jgi:two-component system OmpR family sensor kinase/two-component system sensor histidine kinase BaeS